MADQKLTDSEYAKLRKTKFLSCRCTHPWQDSEYKGKRVFNLTRRRLEKGIYRCTVCGETQ